MPFTPNVASPTNHFPTAAPGDIEVRFTGLLLLIPTPNGAGGTNCKVGALQAPRHSTKITVIDRATLDELHPPSSAGSMVFPVTISTVGAGVTKWVSTATPFPGDDDPDIDKKRDFRWAVDLKALHRDATPKTPTDGLRVIAILKDGLLNTVSPTDRDRMAVHLVPPTGQHKNLNRIAAVIGAHFKLGASDTLTISWTDTAGATKTFPLTAASGSGQGLYVDITNLPDDDTQHDDFNAYYTFGIDTFEQPFKMNFYRIIGIDASEGVDAPCMSGSLDGDGRPGTP